MDFSGSSAEEKHCCLEFVHSFVSELFSWLVSYTEEDGLSKIYLSVMNFVIRVYCSLYRCSVMP